MGDAGFISGLLCRKNCPGRGRPCGYTGASFMDPRPHRGVCPDGGPDGLCLEAESVRKEGTWSFVGDENGTWPEQPGYSYVSAGMGGWEMVMTKAFYGWKLKICLAVLVCIVIITVLGVWEWQRRQSHALNCSHNLLAWSKDWSAAPAEEKRQCCKIYSFSCTHTSPTQKREHKCSVAISAWCCMQVDVGCQFPSRSINVSTAREVASLSQRK